MNGIFSQNNLPAKARCVMFPVEFLSKICVRERRLILFTYIGIRNFISTAASLSHCIYLKCIICEEIITAPERAWQLISNCLSVICLNIYRGNEKGWRDQLVNSCIVFSINQ